MGRDVAPLVRPSTVAIVGASAKRRSQGNGVIQNLQRVGFNGRIIPVHASAPEIDGLPTVPAIEALSSEVDCAVVAIPAPAVAPALEQLHRAGVRSAMVFTNGFAPDEEAAFRRLSDTSAMVIHGPNCMGLINFTNGVPLYPSTVTAKAKTGKLALIAQSGSAAISLMNSTAVGFSKVITMGSEFQVTAPDYMRWFADDDETQVIGVVLEAIQRPDEFAAAAAAIRAAGKRLVVLKVGRSDVGALAVHAHTGAMISRQDAYECFFAQHGIPTARDYDELIASMEGFSACGGVASGSRLGIIGISGGETALACDLAADLGIPVAEWSAETAQRVRAALPGAAERNPLDLGSTVHHDMPQDFEAIGAILDDPGVDALLIVQDTQESLTDTMRGNYTPRIVEYGKLGKKTAKPVVLVSPTGENAHPILLEQLAGSGVAVLRGLRPGMVALRNLGVRAPAAPNTTRRRGAQAAAIEREIDGQAGSLPAELGSRILTAYDIPLVRSAVAASVDEAVRRAGEIGYPLVVKIASRDIAHRSDIGGVVRGVRDAASLREAIARIRGNVEAAAPKARVDGFELQQELVDHVEALVGFIAAPPFGALMTVGTGGTMVELNADRAVRLAPFSPADAAAMIGATRLGKLLGGYRNLIPRTDIAALASLLANLSELASDLAGTIVECDLNPVLVRKGSGEATVVDSLLIAKPC
jgi:acyl-CoA synthetase (NDP forming)